MSKQKSNRKHISKAEVVPSIVDLKDKSKASRDLVKVELENKEELTDEEVEKLLRGRSTSNNQ